MKEHDDMYEMTGRRKGRLFGKYPGLVMDNQDPTGCGRLKVIVPDVMGAEEIWARPCVPYAGNNMGFYAIPEQKTGVWIEFAAGDPSYPIWVGCFWADGQAPKNEDGKEASPPLKIIRSQKGLMITLDDEEQTITMSDKDGHNLITIQVKDGQVTVKGTQRVVVEAPLIDLVEGAKHPVVFGDKLLQYLNNFVGSFLTHTHGPPGSPPPAPLPQSLLATPELISSRVKAG